MSSLRSLAVPLLGLVCLAAACVPSPPPAASSATLGEPAPALRPDPVDDAVRAMVRIRALSCDALSVGSGFAIDDHSIMTNRHVVAGSSEVTVDTWDGLQLDVTDARVSTSHDLALITVSNDLSATIGFTEEPPAAGDTVYVLGYPWGHALRIKTGTVDAIREADTLGADSSDTIVFSADVHHGNSGGPLLDDTGLAVGVIHRKIVGDRDAGLALPSTTVETNLADDAFMANPDCEAAKELFGDQ